LEERFVGYDYLNDTFISDVRDRKWAFMIVDPFDKSYNPAKLIHANTLYADMVKEAMEKTL
jgi:hypothetical protein